MDINDIILTDEALAVIDNGEWVNLEDDAPGVELLVVGLQSEAARRATREKQLIMRKKQRNRELNDDQHSQIMKEVLCEVVLKGWRGLKSNGEDVPYDPALARQWIMSRNGERFTLLVITAAQQLDARANEYVESVGKNSQPASNGNSQTLTLEG